MYVIHSMRLNKFVDRPVASPSALFRIHGYSEPKYQSNQTAESMEVTVPMTSRKTQLLELASRVSLKAAEFSQQPSLTKPLERVSPQQM